MKKTKLLLALCMAGCLANAQVIYKYAGTVGTAGYSGNGGLAISAKLSNPQGAAVDAAGNFYFSDLGNHVVQKVNVNTGIITLVAGTGVSGSTGDGGAASAAKLNAPNGLAFDASGNLYIADQDNQVIRKVTTAGIISKFAGTYTTTGYTGDGAAATAATLNYPIGVGVDASGNVYIVDESNNVIRQVNTSGIINTFAGNGIAGFLGDGGSASGAEFHDPISIVVDGQTPPNIYIGDGSNQRVRKINTAGIINTYAGTGTATYSGNGGQATAAGIDGPYSLALDASGNLFIGDAFNYVVRKVTTGGIISTIAGNNTNSYSGDGGAPTSAGINSTYGLAINSSGDIFLTDLLENDVRKISAKCPANAGLNGTVTNPGSCCSGTPYVIGTPAVSNMSYSWTPSTLLSSTTTATTSSTWSNTATCQIYTVSVSYSLCTTNTSTVQVCAHAYSGPSCCRLANPNKGFDAILPEIFSIYPNPSNQNITVSLYDNAEYIRIMDMQGRLVYETKNTAAGEFKVDISLYTKGMYFITAKIGNTIEKQKLIVE